MFTTNNFRYLRISKSGVLPLNLLLAKEDLEWFNDYSFQEILSVLKPLLLSRIELYNQGHITKRASAQLTTSNSSATIGPYQTLEDGLEDVGIMLGGNGNDDSTSAPATESNESSITRTIRRRGLGGGSGALSGRPRFGIRFGFRASTVAERGGAILVADKNLGFVAVKREIVDDENAIAPSPTPQPQEAIGSRRLSMQLAALEGETPTFDEDTTRPIVIREEDESDSLRVSDFQRGLEETAEASTAGDDDDDYRDENGDGEGTSSKKGKREVAGGRGRGKRKRANTGVPEEPSSQMDQKPTLQVKYTSLKLHPQTLYIVVRSVGQSSSASGSMQPFVKLTEAAASSSSRAGEAANHSPAQQGQEDDEGLFPPGMDYFPLS
ncbi:hypothetical protein BGX28_001849 [Mortierella sp. GBA30]|nr:hypothetical protein BGX28_001849 [Mortierella sp. GBA30]